MYCGSSRKSPRTKAKIYLTEDELILILAQGLVKARKLKSGVRKDSYEKDTHPKIHIAIQGKGKKDPVIIHSDEDAWETGKELAKGKAKTSLHHSSSENAMTSKSVGHLVSSGKVPSLKDGVHFAGGVPLYKKYKGKDVLVGSIGVAGDLPEVDEAIAIAASKGFEAPSHIRSDAVLNVPFDSDILVEELKKESPVTNLPPLPSSVSITDLPTLPKISPPKTPARSVLPPSPRSVLPPSPRSVLPPSPRSVLPPSPRSVLPPSPRSVLPPSPRSVLPPSPRSVLPPSPRSVLPASPAKSSLTSLSSSKLSLPPVQKSPVPIRTSLPPISKLSVLK